MQNTFINVPILHYKRIYIVVYKIKNLTLIIGNTCLPKLVFRFIFTLQAI